MSKVRKEGGVILGEDKSNEQIKANRKYFYKVPDGFPDLSEKDQDAWTSQVFEDFLSQTHNNYEVTVRGAGLFGTAHGKKTFDEVLRFLNEIHARRPLKCRPNWCRPCSLYNLNLNESLVYHVVHISKSNARKIVSHGSFTWVWSNPEGDFARSKTSAEAYWRELSESRSKPVFYTRIMSEEYAEFLLGNGKKV